MKKRIISMCLVLVLLLTVSLSGCGKGNASVEDIDMVVRDANEAITQLADVQEEYLEPNVSYRWVVEPTIEADDIYYLQYGGNWQSCQNETCRQDYTSYAVIQRGDMLGLIDMSGNILVEPEYSFIENMGEMCLLTRAQPIYVPEYNMDMTRFQYTDNQIVPIDGIGGLGLGLFYYDDGLYNTYEDILDEITVPNEAFPVQQGNENQEAKKYAIYCQNTLVTDFIYDECGSVSDGLLAVCQDGKWGYADENGNMVIPMEFDASWDKYNWESEAGGIQYNEFCYAATDGYVTLCKDGQWELRDTSGNLVIEAGVFDKILPVYEGKCWVKENDLWGVIQITAGE